uniref:Small ribosomal subunit protein uS15 N-terminal domain-containing protein n=1 Tax=Catagonus wagneri TaxID=51154 RepID=A0A8C3YIB3_9CETA
MGRMHAPGKGLSQSALPYRRSVPIWLKLTSDDVKEQIYKLAKKGLTPSQMGCKYSLGSRLLFPPICCCL